MKSRELVGSRALGALRGKLQRRRLHAYCVGTPKSGTRSIAGLLESNYRARHEPAVAELLRFAERDACGPAAHSGPSARSARAAALRLSVERPRHDRAAQAKARSLLAWRDLRLWLEFESSFPASIALEVLTEVFEDARFVLTIRHPLDWLESMFNLQPLLAQMSPWQKRWPDMWFGLDRFEHPPAEKVLAEHGLYTLDGYLRFWRDHNDRVLDTVPVERLLVLRTDRISDSARRLARFLGVPCDSLDIARGHLNVTRANLGLATRLDPAYLSDMIERTCGRLLAAHFLEPKEPLA